VVGRRVCLNKTRTAERSYKPIRLCRRVSASLGAQWDCLRRFRLWVRRFKPLFGVVRLHLSPAQILVTNFSDTAKPITAADQRDAFGERAHPTPPGLAGLVVSSRAKQEE
jgi:hypothetical protein